MYNIKSQIKKFETGSNIWVVPLENALSERFEPALNWNRFFTDQRII